MSKGKLTINVQQRNIRWAKRFVKSNRSSIGDLVDNMIESLRSAHASGRVHPWVRRFSDGLFESEKQPNR